MIGEQVIRDINGNPNYGDFNHVMTFINEFKEGNKIRNIITTEGEGGDIRKNPKSKQRTIYWNLNKFKAVSGNIFEKTTRYRYMRINWTYLLEMKRMQ